MKKKTPPFDYLIEELVKSIELRHNKKLPEEQIEVMKSAWKHKQEDLWKMIKNLKQNEVKAKSLTNKVELNENEVEFKIGVSLSGEDIVVKHVIQEKTHFEKQKNPKNPPRKITMQRVLSFMSKTQF